MSALPALPTTLWAQRHPGIRPGSRQDSALLVWALLLALVQPYWSQDSWDLLGHTQTVISDLQAGRSHGWSHGQE